MERKSRDVVPVDCLVVGNTRTRQKLFWQRPCDSAVSEPTVYPTRLRTRPNPRVKWNHQHPIRWPRGFMHVHRAVEHFIQLPEDDCEKIQP